MKAQDNMYVKFICFVRGTRWKLKIVCMLSLYVLSGEQDESSRYVCMLSLYVLLEEQDESSR